jgi:hypothetical protein
MPEPKRRIVKRYEPPAPSESTAQFTGTPGSEPLTRTFYGCPVCGRNGEDKDQIVLHIAQHEPEVGEA